MNTWLFSPEGRSYLLGGICMLLANLLLLLWLARVIRRSSTRPRALTVGALLCLTAGLILIPVAIVQTAGAVRILLYGTEALMLAALVLTLLPAVGGKTRNAAQEERLRQIQAQYQNQYADSVRQQAEAVHRLRHDMNATIQALQTLLREGRTAEAAEYLSSYADALSQTAPVIRTDQPFLDAILNTKLGAAKARGIRCICHVPAVLPPLEGADYCSLLGNLLDNAMEGAAGEQPFVEVSMDWDGRMLTVQVRSSLAGSVLAENPSLHTTKPDHQRHGWGIPTVRAIADKYNGTALFYEEQSCFVAKVRLQGSSEAIGTVYK